MRRRRLGGAALLIVFGAAGGGPGAGSTASIESCLGRTPVADCVRALWEERPPAAADVDALARFLPDHPDALDEIASSALARREDGGDAVADPRLRARLQDLRGQALVALGRYGDGADSFLSALETDAGTARLRWFDADGAALWSVALDAGDGRLIRASRALALADRGDEARALADRAVRLGARGPEVEELGRRLRSPPWPAEGPFRLEAARWRERLPDVGIELLDGGVFTLASARGKVLLLDVWASWCAPCLVELPHFQELVRAETGRGLVGLALNAQESPEVARSTAQALGLTVPVGVYSGELDREFRVRSLPTVILADRAGRIRARWDGYREGIEREIADEARALLDEEPGADTTAVAEVRVGRDALEGWWSRNLDVRIGGLAVVSPVGDEPAIVVAGRGRLRILAPEGEALDDREAPSGVDRLIAADVTEDLRAEIVGFRRGGRDVVLFDAAGTHATRWSAPADVMDVAALERGSASQGALLVATIEGLFLTDPRGENPRRVGEWTPVAGVATAGRGELRRSWVLDARGGLHRLAAGGEAETGGPSLEAPGAWKAVGDGGTPGVGVVPVDVVAHATGKLLDGGGRHAALATASRQLVIVDLARGTAVFRASCDRVGALAAGDLDGDGVDELLVATGSDLTVLRSRRDPRLAEPVGQEPDPRGAAPSHRPD